MRRQQRIQPRALVDGEFSGKQLSDVPVGIGQRFADHALDLSDAGHDDAASPELVQQHAREDGTAGRGQRDRQQPSLQRSALGTAESREPEHIA